MFLYAKLHALIKVCVHLRSRQRDYSWVNANHTARLVKSKTRERGMLVRYETRLGLVKEESLHRGVVADDFCKEGTVCSTNVQETSIIFPLVVYNDRLGSCMAQH